MHEGFRELDAVWSERAGGGPVHLASAPLPDAMRELVEAVGSPLIQHVRDSTYYRWRFRNPRSDYRFVYWRESRLEGFLVLQASLGVQAADLRIVDWESSRPEILEAMVSRLVRGGGYDRLSIWTATLPDAFLDVLRRGGFVPRDETRGDLDYRPGLMAIGPGGSDLHSTAAADAPPLRDPARWGLRMAFSDAF